MFNDPLRETDWIDLGVEQLANVMVIHGIPECVNSDNGPDLMLKSDAVGYLALVLKLPILNPVVLGRMTFVRALIVPSETIF